MDTKTLLAWAEIAKQVEAGKVRQWRARADLEAGDEWSDIIRSDGWHEENEYRIKPTEPREVWMRRVTCASWPNGLCRESSQWVESEPGVKGAVKFREVLE